MSQKKKKINWKQKSLVDVYINLENDLMNPDVKFNIDFPRINESDKTIFENVLSNSEEMNKASLFTFNSQSVYNNKSP